MDFVHFFGLEIIILYFIITVCKKFEVIVQNHTKTEKKATVHGPAVNGRGLNSYDKIYEKR